MATVIFNSFKKKLLNATSTAAGFANLASTGTVIKVALCTSAYAANQDSHSVFSQVTNESTGAGYVAGGATLTAKTVTQDDTDNEGVFDAADVTWAASTITARHAVVYRSIGSSTNSPLIASIDFGSNKSSNSGNFTITWSSEGIVNLNSTV